MTNRDRMAEHATNKACAGCHNLIDPIGFGFEKFDAIGQRRDKLKLTFGESFGESKGPRPKLSTVELDLDTKGQVAGIPNSSFASPRELGAVLAASPQCQECIVKQYFRYVAGRTRNARRPAADPPGLRGLPQLRLPLSGNDNLDDEGQGNAAAGEFPVARRGECRR